MKIGNINLDEPKVIIEPWARFIEELDSMGGNVFIGGSVALQLHGIIPARVPEDLDIIVHNPTEAQMKYIIDGMGISEGEHLEFDEYHDTEAEGVPEDPKMCDSPTERRSYRFGFDSNGLKTMNILIEREPRYVGHTLLFGYVTASKHKRIFSVQDVATIIAKKKKYNREKDIQDLRIIADTNF